MSTQRAEYTVVGMTCDHCVRAVNGEVSRLAGVTAIDIDLGSGRLVLVADRRVPDEEVIAAVEEAGYAVAR